MDRHRWRRASVVAVVAAMGTVALGAAPRASGVPLPIPGPPACASTLADGAGGPARRDLSRQFVVTRDGRYVVYSDWNVDTNAVRLFRVDRETGTTTLLSTSFGSPTGPSAISDDGTLVLSSEGLRNVVTDTLQNVVVGADGQPRSGSPLSLSGDGRYVAFSSADPDVTADGNPDAVPNLYLRDRVAGTTVHVNATPGPPPPGDGPWRFGIARLSADGRYLQYIVEDQRSLATTMRYDRLTATAMSAQGFKHFSDDGLHYVDAGPRATMTRTEWSTGATDTVLRPPWAGAISFRAASNDERWVLVTVESDVQSQPGTITVTPMLYDRLNATFAPAASANGGPWDGPTVLSDGTVIGFEWSADQSGPFGVRLRIVQVRSGLTGVIVTVANALGTFTRGAPTAVVVRAIPGVSLDMPPGVTLTWAGPEHVVATITVPADATPGWLPVRVTGPTGCVATVERALEINIDPPLVAGPTPIVTGITGDRSIRSVDQISLTLQGPNLGSDTTVTADDSSFATGRPGPSGYDVDVSAGQGARRGYHSLLLRNGGGPTAVVDRAFAVRDVAGEFTPMHPQRVYDSRDAAYGPPQRLGPGEERTIRAITGLLPDVVDAVVLNVTGIDATQSTFLSVYPAGVERPLASNLNLVPGQTVPNLVTVGTDDRARVTLYNNSGSVDVAVDIVGFYSRLDPGTGGTGVFLPVVPTRLLDTRDDLPRPLGAGEVVRLPVVQPGSPVRAAVLNVTVTDTTAASFLTVVPANDDHLQSSNLNWTAGQTVPNLVVVGVDRDGQVDLYNHAGSTHVVVDLLGLYDDDTLPVFEGQLGTRTPLRVLDTRQSGAKVEPGRPATLDFDAAGLIPLDATAVVINVTVTEPDRSGYLTVYPGDVATPLASNLNFVRGQTVPNLVVVPVSAAGTIQLAAGVSATHVVADLVGWFAPSGHRPPGVAAASVRGAAATAQAAHAASPVAVAGFLAPRDAGALVVTAAG